MLIPHSSVIQDTHFLLTSTGWAGLTPTHSDLSSVFLTLTSTFQYTILIRPIFTFNFFPLCALHALFSGIFLEVNFIFTLSNFWFQCLPTITMKSALKDKIISWGGPEIWYDLIRKGSYAASSQELNRAAVSVWCCFLNDIFGNKTI